MATRRIVVTLLSAAALILGVSLPASAAGESKLTVMFNWTQPTLSSYQAWNSARLNQGAWVEYRFDWSTDYCSASPDQPLGFDFRLSCWHHDFGYRNYKAVGQFPQNKGRVDDTFYADLRRVCGTYPSWTRPSCYSLAWTYYQAVRQFGDLAVSKADLDAAQAQYDTAKARYEADAAARAGAV